MDFVLFAGEMIHAGVHKGACVVGLDERTCLWGQRPFTVPRAHFWWIIHLFYVDGLGLSGVGIGLETMRTM